MNRATRTLNLSQVPKTIREDVGIESVLQLKEIFDHIKMPAMDEVPRAEDLTDRETRSWRIPLTDITIARVNEGSREGAWLFTAETVARMDDYYKLLEESRGADKKSARAYEEYIYSPGWMVPAGIIKALPTWMRTGIFEQALWQWISLVIVIAFGLVVLWWTRQAANWLLSKMASESRKWHWERLLFPVFGVLFIHAILYFIDEQVNITGHVLIIVSYGIKLVIFVFAVWSIFILGDLVSEGIAHVQHLKSASIGADVTRLVIRVLSYAIIFFLFFHFADRLGIPVGAVFASAGIAGFAVAMAAKDSLSNLFGGVTIFLDRPFQTGDYIVLDDNERGEVVQIGLRSTRIKTRDDVMITIPNSIITNTKIVNQSSPEPMFRVRIKLGVAYGSDIKQVETILIGQVRSNPLAAQHPDPRVRFRNFGDSALEFELLCWAKRPHDRGKLMHELNTSIYNAFAEAGIQIPFPQRDVYIRSLPEDGRAPGRSE